EGDHERAEGPTFEPAEGERAEIQDDLLPRAVPLSLRRRRPAWIGAAGGRADARPPDRATVTRAARGDRRATRRQRRGAAAWPAPGSAGTRGTRGSGGA